MTRRDPVVAYRHMLAHAREALTLVKRELTSMQTGCSIWL